VSALSEAVLALPTAGILLGIFIVGHILGTLLLGIAAYRSGLVPRPVAVALAASQFVHLAAVIAGLPWLDLLAWGTTALGMAFLARAVLRTPDDQWDLPPARLRS
jgi:membrane-bound ClpP family serine protease